MRLVVEEFFEKSLYAGILFRPGRSEIGEAFNRTVFSGGVLPPFPMNLDIQI